MNEKKEKFIIFALAGILLLIICLPVKNKQSGKTETGLDGIYNNSSYINDSRKTAKESGNNEDSGAVQTGAGAEAVKGGLESYTERLETELEELLACMEGVGRARVMITLRSTGEEIVEKDRPANRSNLTESDSSGGSRNTNELGSEESTVFVTDADGRQIPYVRKTLQPDIEGVAVLAEGGGRKEVRENISEAIQALFGIDANKIKIAKMKMTR